MSAGQGTTKTVVIIGGGVSGALTAYHLVLQHADAEVVVIDPRPELGLGLAYSTPSLHHLLNVPAGKISALPQEPHHFLEWLRAGFDPEATPLTFAPRAIFGRYIRSLLAGSRGITQRQGSVVDLEPRGDAAVLTLGNGDKLWADFVVLATGNFDPAALPGIESGVVESGAYCHNAWLPETYQDLSVDAPATLIGSGLTAVDVLLRLRELGHRGVITAISRHGIFPSRHAAYTAATTTAIPTGTPATCLAYLRAFRLAMASGIEWRAAIDSLRESTNGLWLALSLKEQERFRRHLQRHWDVVRHRMAPPNADLIEAELTTGTLRLREGHLQSVAAEGRTATVHLRTHGGTERVHTARVINCTGPSMNYRRVNSPMLDRLFAQGVVQPGPLGGGLNTTRNGALISSTGEVSSYLFNLGPGRLGTLLESIAIPEIRQQAVEIARTIEDQLRQAQSSPSMRPRSHSVAELAVA